jgi:hypothetical protein
METSDNVLPAGWYSSIGYSSAMLVQKHKARDISDVIMQKLQMRRRKKTQVAVRIFTASSTFSSCPLLRKSTSQSLTQIRAKLYIK